MCTEFLQTSLNDFREVALLVLLRNADGFFDFSFLQAAGDRGCEFARLLAGGTESNVAIDHDADRPRRKNGEHDDDALGEPSHRCPHAAKVKGDLLQEHNCKKVQMVHKVKVLLNPV